MSLKNLVILMTVGIFVIVVAGCGTGNKPTSSDSAQVSLQNAGKAIPTDAVINSATIHIYVSETDAQSVSVHAVTSEWDESTITWSSFAGAYSSETIGTFEFTEPGWYTLDVTSQVEGWFDESIENFGFYLQYGGEGDVNTTIASSEADENSPYLEICYTVHEGDTCEDMETAGDATIFSSDTEVNYGDSPDLIVGGSSDQETERSALIKFEFSTEVRHVSLGGQVFNDANADGTIDEGELGMEGITVNLYDCDNSLLATTVTDADGMYLFESLMSGDYMIEFEAPEGYLFSAPENGLTECMTLLPGDENLAINAGLFAYDGCTYGKGYWKNHAGFGPQNDELSKLLPIWLGANDGEKSLAVTDAQTAYDILTQHVYGHPKNGITKLYAHLLTAKLNIVNSSNPEDINDVMAEADAFLAEYDWNDWDMLDKDQQQMVNQWKGHLEDYNEGLIGPGQCGDDEDEYESGD